MHTTRRHRCWRIAPLVAVLIAATSAVAGPPPFALLDYKPLGIWTARDEPHRREIDLRGTDLGVSFPFVRADGKRDLFFLFGDTHHFGEDRTGRFDEDSIARVEPAWADRLHLPALEWLTRPDGKWLSLRVPGEDLRAMEVPLDGVQVGRDVVLFFNADWNEQQKRHGALVCAVARGGDFAKLEKRFKHPSDKFLNVSASADPRDPASIWIFGTGVYRQSAIYLAKAPAATLDDVTTWRFRAGGGWSAQEADATPIVDGRIGELSARYVPAAQSWVLLYQRRMPGRHYQGVYARFAATPDGAWSDELPLLEPDADRGIGFGQFMHRATKVIGYSDGLSNPGRENESGDPYGPYLVPSWCYVEGDRLHLIHTISSWNPYQSHLSDAVLVKSSAATTAPVTRPAEASLRDEPIDVAPAISGVAPTTQPAGAEEWRSWQGGGTWSQTWSVDPKDALLCFRLRGRGVVAQLFDDTGLCVRQTAGDAATADTIEIHWRLDDLHGKTVRLDVIGKPNAPDDQPAFTVPMLSSRR